MTPIPMEALGRQNYKGRWYSFGETIQVDSEADAQDMIVTNFARRIKQVPATVPAPAERGMEAEEQVQVESTSADLAPVLSKKQNKRYKHREMRVDER